MFFDAYGVLNGAGGAFTWTEATLQHLAATEFPFYVVSNDSSNLVPGISAKLNRGAAKPVVTDEQVISSGIVCQHYVETHFEGASLVYYGEPKSLGYLDAAKRVDHVMDAEDGFSYDAFVVLGNGEVDWRTSLDRSVNLIRNLPEAALLAPNPDILFYAGQDKVGIAAGSLACLLERAVGRSFKYFGKPHKDIFDFAFNKALKEISSELNPADILMVGDNLHTDIKGANAMGFGSCLTLSGNTTRQNYDLECHNSGSKPDHVVDSISL